MNDFAQENPLFFDLPTLDLTRFSEPPNPPSAGEKYLVFFSGDEFYAVPSKKVVEVAPTIPVTILPNAPEWLLGIANLRGEVISVVSLPALLGKKTQSPRRSRNLLFCARRLSSPARLLPPTASAKS